MFTIFDTIRALFPDQTIIMTQIFPNFSTQNSYLYASILGNVFYPIYVIRYPIRLRYWLFKHLNFKGVHGCCIFILFIYLFVLVFRWCLSDGGGEVRGEFAHPDLPSLTHLASKTVKSSFTIRSVMFIFIHQINTNC